jgi:hypothetical protein
MQQLCNGVSMLLMGNKLDVRNGLRDRRLWNRARFWMQGQEGSRTRKKHPLLDPQLVMRDGRGFGLGLARGQAKVPGDSPRHRGSSRGG